MLVLSRHRDEVIIIGDEIEVTVVDIRGDQVRLGIKAAKSISIHRKEIYNTIKREELKASQLDFCISCGRPNPCEVCRSTNKETIKLKGFGNIPPGSYKATISETKMLPNGDIETTLSPDQSDPQSRYLGESE